MVDTITYILNIWRNNFISVDVEVALPISSFKSRQSNRSSARVVSEASTVMGDAINVSCRVGECLIVRSRQNSEDAVISFIQCASSVSCAGNILDCNLLTNFNVVWNLRDYSYSRT